MFPRAREAPAPRPPRAAASRPVRARRDRAPSPARPGAPGPDARSERRGPAASLARRATLVALALVALCATCERAIAWGAIAGADGAEGRTRRVSVAGSRVGGREARAAGSAGLEAGPGRPTRSGSAASPPPLPPGPWSPAVPLFPSHRRREIPDSRWSRTMEALWNETRSHVGFCVGGSKAEAFFLLKESFAWPPPTGPLLDPICSTNEAQDPFVCDPDEVVLYARYMLETNDPEKVPDTPACPAGEGGPACAPGFFDAHRWAEDGGAADGRGLAAEAAASAPAADGSTPRRRPPRPPALWNATQKPHACCPGFFCPSQLTCMMPCPRGAFCPRAHPALPPKPYRGGLGTERMDEGSGASTGARGEWRRGERGEWVRVGGGDGGDGATRSVSSRDREGSELGGDRAMLALAGLREPLRPRARASGPPASARRGASGSLPSTARGGPDASLPLALSSASSALGSQPSAAPGDPGVSVPQWCAPYAYKRRASLGCGGADRWSVTPPKAAFPSTKWIHGSGSIYCPAGRYCPSSLANETCPPGHACRQGTWTPRRCPFGSVCPEGTSRPRGGVAGAALVAGVAGFLGCTWVGARILEAITRDLEPGQRLAVVRGSMGVPRVQVIEVPEGAGGAEGGEEEADADRAGSERSGGDGGEGEGGEVGEEEGGEGDEVERGRVGSWSEDRSPPARSLTPSPPRSLGTTRFVSSTDDLAEPLLSPRPLPPPALLAPAPAPVRALGRIPLPSLSSSATARQLSPSSSASPARPPPPEIRFERVHARVRRSGRPLLRDVSGRLPARSLTAVLGPSGAGKSTFLEALAGRSARGIRVGGKVGLFVDAGWAEARGDGAWAEAEDEGAAASGSARAELLGSANGGRDGAPRGADVGDAGTSRAVRNAAVLSDPAFPDPALSGVARPPLDATAAAGPLPLLDAAAVAGPPSFLDAAAAARPPSLRDDRRGPVPGSSTSPRRSPPPCLPSPTLLPASRSLRVPPASCGVGFVPQDDSLLPELTVEETLLFAARIRHPRGTPAPVIKRAVKRTLSDLGLLEVRHQRVGGGGSARGVSGGQRRRAAVGVELVARPGLLLLDEPTSGLDSSSACGLVGALRDVCTRGSGVTAVAVVHAPSARVLDLFTELVLLAPGGRAVYAGERAGAPGYFEHLGLVPPKGANLAEAYLDLLSGDPVNWTRLASAAEGQQESGGGGSGGAPGDAPGDGREGKGAAWSGDGYETTKRFATSDERAPWSLSPLAPRDDARFGSAGCAAAPLEPAKPTFGAASPAAPLPRPLSRESGNDVLRWLATEWAAAADGWGAEGWRDGGWGRDEGREAAGDDVEGGWRDQGSIGGGEEALRDRAAAPIGRNDAGSGEGPEAAPGEAPDGDAAPAATGSRLWGAVWWLPGLRRLRTAEEAEEGAAESGEAAGERARRGTRLWDEGAKNSAQRGAPASPNDCATRLLGPSAESRPPYPAPPAKSRPAYPAPSALAPEGAAFPTSAFASGAGATGTHGAHTDASRVQWLGAHAREPSLQGGLSSAAARPPSRLAPSSAGLLAVASPRSSRPASPLTFPRPPPPASSCTASSSAPSVSTLQPQPQPPPSARRPFSPQHLPGAPLLAVRCPSPPDSDDETGDEAVGDRHPLVLLSPGPGRPGHAPPPPAPLRQRARDAGILVAVVAADAAADALASAAAAIASPAGALRRSFPWSRGGSGARSSGDPRSGNEDRGSLSPVARAAHASAFGDAPARGRGARTLSPRARAARALHPSPSPSPRAAQPLRASLSPSPHGARSLRPAFPPSSPAAAGRPAADAPAARERSGTSASLVAARTASAPGEARGRPASVAASGRWSRSPTPELSRRSADALFAASARSGVLLHAEREEEMVRGGAETHGSAGRAEARAPGVAFERPLRPESGLAVSPDGSSAPAGVVRQNGLGYEAREDGVESAGAFSLPSLDLAPRSAAALSPFPLPDRPSLASAEPPSPPPSAARARLPRLSRPGFLQQLGWCLGRAATRRSRQPLAVLTDYSIVSATGLALGLLGGDASGTLEQYAVSATYSVVAVGIVATVGSLPALGGGAASALAREAQAGLDLNAAFFAVDALTVGGCLLRALVYLAAWASVVAPRAGFFASYAVAFASFFACSGAGHVLALALPGQAAQLTAAVASLVAALLARTDNLPRVVDDVSKLSYARWSLEAHVVAEASKLDGVWLLARCADLAGLGYDVRRFWGCVGALFALGVLARTVALGLLHAVRA